MTGTCSMDSDWSLAVDGVGGDDETVPNDVMMWLLEKQYVLDPSDFDDDHISATNTQTPTSDRSTSLHTLQACSFTAPHYTSTSNTATTCVGNVTTRPQTYIQLNRPYYTTCMYGSSPDQSVPCCSPPYAHSEPPSTYMQLDSSGDTDHSSLESGNGEYTRTCMQSPSYHGGSSASHPAMTYMSEDSNDSFELPPSSDLNVTGDLSNNLSVADQDKRLPSFHTIMHKEAKKGRRGRPVTFPKPGCHYSSSEGDSEDEDTVSTCSPGPQSPSKRRGAKNVLLWKFLLEELSNPHGTAHIQWVNAGEGSFRFVDTNEISRRWGAKKNKTDMNFEKLSRGIRHYYKDGLMSRQERTRLVYKFNWDRVPRAYRKL